MSDRPEPVEGRPQCPATSHRAGLTQEQLAERTGFSQQYISKFEKGRRNPTIVTLFELATGLGASPVDLVRPD